LSDSDVIPIFKIVKSILSTTECVGGGGVRNLIEIDVNINITRNKNKNYAINEVKIPESVIQNKKYMV